MLTNKQLEALATVHLHPQTQAGGDVDLTPLLRAVEDAATEQATARQNASWRLMCEQMVAEERERAARVCDDEARIRVEAGSKHGSGTPEFDRCMAAARAARNCALGVRGGEVVGPNGSVEPGTTVRRCDSARTRG